VWFIGIAAPAGFLGLLLILGWLEDTIVLPLERAARVRTLLENASADQIEDTITQMFAPVVPRRGRPLQRPDGKAGALKGAPGRARVLDGARRVGV